MSFIHIFFSGQGSNPLSLIAFSFQVLVSLLYWKQLINFPLFGCNINIFLKNMGQLFYIYYGFLFSFKQSKAYRKVVKYKELTLPLTILSINCWQTLYFLFPANRTFSLIITIQSSESKLTLSTSTIQTLLSFADCLVIIPIAKGYSRDYVWRIIGIVSSGSCNL